MPYLAWDNKAEAQHLADHVPYHFLELDHFYGDIVAGNKLIRGDNILVLKALLPFYANKIKCIYIDPPYNTQSNFDHYDDAMAHDDWLSMMYPRLVLLKQLLATDGSIWVSINDRESHYLKVLMDEVFGREHFLANITWQTKSLPEHKSSGISQTHDHILGYRASAAFQPRLVHDRSYKSRNVHNPDQDPRGPWLASPLLVADNNPARFFAVPNPHGHPVYPPKDGSWKRSPIQLAELERDGRIWWGKHGKSRRPAEKVFVSDMVHGMVNQTWWSHEFAGCSAEAEQELLDIFKGELFFDTPKPEKLIARLLSMSTEPGDWVLDCFLGSGTTAAVAHKMGRHYIGIERGEHAQTHCATRLQKVIDGEQGGISRQTGWQGGGGFQLFQLGLPMFLPDGRLSSVAEFQALAAYLWLLETGVPNSQPLQCPLLGVYQGTAYYLLFNHAHGGDVLSADLIEGLLARYPHDGPKVIYADNTLLPSAYLGEKQIRFKSLRQVITAEVV